ncbi:hypothetical protein JFMEOBDD_00148 [Streptococcus equi subsp. zooepidemicus]|nr:hypothetical protein JFMEOBDD_00148 [Streptococcus equi subsp. zooepidemicus]
MKRTKRLSELKGSRLKAFTLIECLIALLVISGSLLAYQALTKSLMANERYLAANDQNDWLLFSQQLRAELSGTTLQGVRNNRLYVEKDKKALSFGQVKGHDFRKAASNGQGYQPMLFGLSSSQITAVGQQVTIKLKWQSGLERTFIYAFQEKG